MMALLLSKGHRFNIFQSECKIKEKVCRLIIDGGSFTYIISSDLVHALSLSTWRLPTPRYVQWMNQSGTLKITHRTRVKFSVGTYVDTVDCDVAPLRACHLLLGAHGSLILMLHIEVVPTVFRLCIKDCIMF